MSFTEFELQEECGAVFHQRHQCDQNELPDHLRIYHLSLEDKPEHKHWELFTLWLANASDVASGEAENEGEVLNLSSVKIAFCPFCGTHLSL